jgi:hypothetical protein
MARARAVLETSPAPARGRAKSRSRRPQPVPTTPPRERRYRQTIHSVDLWSVLKISVCFYLCALIVLLGAGVVLWWIGSSVGVISNVEDFVEELFGWSDFEFLSWPILRGATLLGLVFVCLLVVATTLAAALYNLFSDLLGGVEIVVAEEEDQT